MPKLDGGLVGKSGPWHVSLLHKKPYKMFHDQRDIELLAK